MYKVTDTEAWDIGSWTGAATSASIVCFITDDEARWWCLLTQVGDFSLELDNTLEAHMKQIVKTQPRIGRSRKDLLDKIKDHWAAELPKIGLKFQE
jgi:hypothetical protein